MTQRNRESQLVIRCDMELREMCEESARRQGQSIAEWMRRAAQEKLDREKSCAPPAGPAPTDEELDARIEAVLRRMMEKQKKEG